MNKNDGSLTEWPPSRLEASRFKGKIWGRKISEAKVDCYPMRTDPSPPDRASRSSRGSFNTTSMLKPGKAHSRSM